MLTRESRLVVSPGVLFNLVDGEAVLLNQQTGLYFGLNELGSRIWTLIVDGATLGKVQDELVGDFDVGPEVLWSDIVELVAEMRNEGLVLDGPTPAGPSFGA